MAMYSIDPHFSLVQVWTFTRFGRPLLS